MEIGVCKMGEGSWGSQRGRGESEFGLEFASSGLQRGSGRIRVWTSGFAEGVRETGVCKGIRGKRVCKLGFAKGFKRN